MVTPRIEPGMLPAASARTTLRRTVPLFRCTMPEPILVTRLKTASDPTGTIAGTFRPKIRRGSRSTPPPSPVIPIRVPTTKPIVTLSAMSMTEFAVADLSRGCGGVRCDKSFPLQVKNDFLGSFFRGKVCGVDHHLGVLRFLVRIRNASELFQDTGARFGVQ